MARREGGSGPSPDEGVLSSEVAEALLVSVDDLCAVVATDGTIRYVDPSVTDVLGSAPDAVVGENIHECVHPDDRAAVEAALGRESDSTVACRVETAHGGWQPLEADVHVTDAVDGVLVTARAANEVTALPRYQRLVEAAADPMYWLSPDGTVELVNDAMVEMTDIPRERLVGDDVSAYVAADDITAIEADISEWLSTDAEDALRHEFTLELPGEERWVESTFAPVVEDGTLRGTAGVIRDITRRKRREESLARYQTIAETAPVGLFTLDEDGVITWANERYADTLGVLQADLTGRPFLDLVEEGFYDEEVVEPYFETVRDLLSSDTDRSEGTYIVETNLPGGETLVHEVYTALLPMEDGEFRGTVSAFRDITTQKRYQRELERQNERLDEFASVVSHDLRNPLAIAEGYVERAAETGDLDHLETVREAHERMRVLIADLLALARQGEAVTDPSLVEVAAVARQAWDSVETGDTDLVVADVGTVFADADRLQQLFENLFRNAVEHGSTGNQTALQSDDAVEHGARTADAADLTVTVGPLDGGFFVADDGVGIPEDERATVFDRGYSTAARGTGFGLAIVETIAEAHGWEVTLTESEGGGARFEFETD